jgi:hypothetical protein
VSDARECLTELERRYNATHAALGSSEGPAWVVVTGDEVDAIRAMLAENERMAAAELDDAIAGESMTPAEAKVAALEAALAAKDAELVRLIDKAAAIIGSEYRNVGVVEAAIDWLAGKRDQARQRAERAERIISREERISDGEMMALLRRVNKDFEAELGEFNEHLSMLASTLACGMPGKKTPDQWCRLISDGIDMLTRPLLERAERAEADAAELHRVLEQTVTVPEYDCPGDTPELCGWSCMLCRGNDEHKYDCVIAKDNPGQPLLDELARLREACEKPSNDPNGRGWASLVDGLDIITKADKEVAAARFEHWKAWAAIRLAQLRAALATKEPNQPG